MIFVSFDQAKEKKDSIFSVLALMKIKQIQCMEFANGQEF
jgi:hypothetical protein